MRAFHSLLASIIMLALTGIGPQTSSCPDAEQSA